MFAGKGKKLDHDGVDMGADGGDGLFLVAGQNAIEDGLVFGNGQSQATRGDDQPAGAIEIGAGRIDDVLDLGEFHGAEDDVVEFDIELVKGLGVVALGSFAFFGLSGKGEVADLQGCKGHCAQDDVDKARTKLVIADISLGVGIVALGVATYMFVTRPKVEGDVKAAHAHAHASPGKLGFDLGAVSGGAVGSVGGRF